MVDYDSDLEAAEYVIGLLTPAEARAVEKRAANDPSIAAKIRSWEFRLAPLTAGIAPQAGPASVWQRLETSIEIKPVSKPAPPRLWWRWVSAPAFRGAMVGATCVSLVVGGYVGYKTWLPATEIAAVISLDGKNADYKVEITPDGYASVVAVDPNFPANGALQFWTLDGATPVSLGLLPAKGRFKLNKRLVPGAKLLISKEPEGGSPEAAPTGPIVYQGNLIHG